MGIMTSVSVIFNTGYTYSFSSIKEYFVDIEENIFPIKLKVIAKGIEIYWEYILFLVYKVCLNGRELISISSVKDD